MSNMNIPFTLPYITEDDIDAVNNILRSNWLTMGNKTIEFEEEFAKYIESKYAVSLNSCTSALFLSLKALGINDGEVILPSFTFTATANVVVHANAKPVFVDIDEDSYNIDVNKIEEKITDNTRAIIAVHYAGLPAYISKIMKIAKRHNLKVIEDAAHAAGSRYPNNKHVGSLGNLTCFSFYATKPMTTGEGGMVTLNNRKITEWLKVSRLHGISKDAWKRYIEKDKWYYEVIDAGYKFNTTDINSSLGLSQLKKLDWMNEKRKEIARYYNDHLNKHNIILPKFNNNSSFHLYPIRLINYNRNKFIRRMAEHGIGTSVHFIPLHLMPFYRRYGYRKGDLPITEKVFNSIVSLPIYPQLTLEQLDYIIRCINDILNE